MPAAPQQAIAEVVERCREPRAVAEPARDRGVLLVAGDSPIDVAQVAERDPQLVERERGSALVAESTEKLEARLRGPAHTLVVTEAVRHERSAGQRLRPQHRRRRCGVLQRVVDPGPPLAQMVARRPEVRERAHEAELQLDRPARARPVERGAEVVLLGLETSPCRPRSAGGVLVLGSLRELGVVQRVALAGRVSLAELP